MQFLQSRKFFGPFFAHFLWLLREKLDIFIYLNINLIFEMFISNDKKVQGPQKQGRGPHAARGPHFGMPAIHYSPKKWRMLVFRRLS